MAPKCCVPGCFSNYDSTLHETGYVTIFKFPSEEDKLALWVKAIPRKGFKPSKYSVVCVKHFDQSDLSYVDVSTDKQGNLQEFPRNRCLLKPDAIPRIFPGLPERLNKPSTSTRVDPTARKDKHVKTLEDQQDQWLQNDIILSFSDFCNGVENFQRDINSKWKLCVQSNFVCFFVLNCENIPRVDASVKIAEDLRIQVCIRNQILGAAQFSWIIPGEKLQRWSQLQNLLVRCSNSTEEDVLTEPEAVWLLNDENMVVPVKEEPGIEFTSDSVVNTELPFCAQESVKEEFLVDELEVEEEMPDNADDCGGELCSKIEIEDNSIVEDLSGSAVESSLIYSSLSMMERKSRGQPSLKGKPPLKKRYVVKAAAEHRFDGQGHYPMKTKKQNASRCHNVNCKSKTRYQCTKCEDPLCPECFESFHCKI